MISVFWRYTVQKVILKKIKSNHNNLDRDIYTGVCTDLPMIGEQFTMLTREDGRLITTRVQWWEKHMEDKTISFKTKNSEYLLVLED